MNTGSAAADQSHTRVLEVAWWDARHRGGRCCGMPGEPPGLMLGLAGIGLAYLRLHDERTFSPLGIGTSQQPVHARGADIVKETV